MGNCGMECPDGCEKVAAVVWSSEVVLFLEGETILLVVGHYNYHREDYPRQRWV